MTLKIELTRDQEARLQAEADTRGMDPQSVLQHFVETLPSTDAEPFREHGTPEEEAADEAAWAERFEKSGDLLEKMAAEADEEHVMGRTVPLETLFEKHG